jgi:tetratricopeptide (TPR) repeat protein
VTFPQWSPREDKLSLWVTFMPSHRSVLSHLLGWGLRPGDPAAVFDLKTGQLGWLPVHAQEKVQVGHYYLLKRDYAQAWRWYQEAERDLPPPAPVEVHDLSDYWRALQGPRDFSFFQYHCLSKLGRAAEAQIKLDQFQRCFLPRFEPGKSQTRPATVIVDGKTLEQHLQELVNPANLIGSLTQDLYMAEVFLSLDAPEDAEAFFRRALDHADTDATRLSRAIVLGQILLLTKKHREYAALTTDTIAPLLTRILKPGPAGGRRDFLDVAMLVELVGELALLPLGSAEFLSLLPKEQLQDMRPRWEMLQAEANERAHPLLDLVLRGLYQALGQEKERQETAVRIQKRAAYVLPVEEEVGKSIRTLHMQCLGLLQRR